MASEPYSSLLDSAKEHHKNGDYQESIILAQTAAELFVERAFDSLFERRNIEYLQKAVERLLYHNYNLGHDKTASLYEALSADHITKQPFWSQYKAHTELRNDIVHQGRTAISEDSSRSLKAVQDLIDHISGVLA
jgi:hypothetical protein